MLNQFRIRTPLVLLLHLSDHVCRHATQTLGYVDFVGTAVLGLANLERYLFFSERVVLETLRRLTKVDLGSEGIVQSKLTRKHVHEDSLRADSILSYNT